MNISDFFSVAGILLTIIFGYLGIRLVKRNKYPGKIVYIEDHCISLFNSIVKNFPEIQIIFDQQPVNEQLVLLKGGFINVGEIDIKPEMVDEQLKIILPDGFKFINAKIISSPTQKSNLKILSNSLQFDLGLFRKRERLNFEAIIQVRTENDPVREIMNNIHFEHRISDTQKVLKGSLIAKDVAKKAIKGGKNFTKYYIIIALLFSALIGFASLFGPKNGILYKTLSNSKDSILVTITKETNKPQFEVSEYDGKFKESLTFDQLNQLKEVKVDYQYDFLSVFYKLLLVFLIFLAIIWIFLFIDYYTKKKKVAAFYDDIG